MQAKDLKGFWKKSRIEWAEVTMGSERALLGLTPWLFIHAGLSTPLCEAYAVRQAAFPPVSCWLDSDMQRSLLLQTPQILCKHHNPLTISKQMLKLWGRLLSWNLHFTDTKLRNQVFIKTELCSCPPPNFCCAQIAPHSGGKLKPLQ